MILPIVAYGAPILRAKCSPVQKDDLALQALLADMWETLENANGSGLAAPQVNVNARIFIVNSRSSFERMDENEKNSFRDSPGIQQAFINPHILSYEPEKNSDEEGCLSIPGIWQEVSRFSGLTMSYYDEAFRLHTETFYDLTARMIQHEYDHIEGKLYLDYLSPLTRKLLKSKLNRIQKGEITCRYPMKFL